MIMVNDYWKILGQISPAPNVATTIYTVPEGRSALIEALVVTNPTGAGITFKVWVLPYGDTVDTKHLIAGDVAITANEAKLFRHRLMVQKGDQIIGSISVGGCSIGAFGSEQFIDQRV